VTDPTLPQHDPDAAGRAAGLDTARSEYEYDYSYQGLCFTAELPERERFDRPYLEQGAKASLALKANDAITGLTRRAGEVSAGVEAIASGVRSGELGHPVREVMTELRSHGDTARVEDMAEYDGMFRALREPAAKPIWSEDWAFAWQRIAGSVPTLIRRLDDPLDHLGVTDAHVAAALGDGVTLDAARREGRLFVCDYRRFDGIPGGRFPPKDPDGVPKHVQAPIALFYASAGAGLRPVAIQCGQTPDAPIHTPADGLRWRLAKTVVQVADANLEGIVVHFGYTHMIIQRFVIAARRQLSARHPLLALLAPHFRYTLAANDYSREDLVMPDGTQERVLAPALEATLAVLRESIREVELDDLDPILAAARAGVDDADVLPVHPFRDDQRTVYEATRRWVDAYLSLYYPSDADVAADLELRAFIDEVGSPDGGRLRRLVSAGAPTTRAGLIDLVARVIHRAATYHAAINYNWYDWMAYVPNLPAAASIRMPGPDEPVDESTLLAMMPPRSLGFEQLAQVWSVDSIHVEMLGEYPQGFADPRVAPRLERFRAELRAAEATIDERNTERRLAYTCLKPSRVTASIHS